MFWGSPSGPAGSGDRVHQAVKSTPAEPSNLPASTPNDALVRIIRNDEVADAKRFDGHLFSLCRLGAGAALGDFLHHRASGLAGLMLPMIVAAADHEAG